LAISIIVDDQMIINRILGHVFVHEFLWNCSRRAKNWIISQNFDDFFKIEADSQCSGEF